VNLSARQFSHPGIVDQIREALATTGLAPAALRLEITELAIIDKGRYALSILSQLREIGVQVYLDDFGTGYSSLSYLHGVPVDGIKIDREFVSEMDTNESSMRLVRTLLTLAEIVGIRAEAEGIASVDQLGQLRALNCGQGQGYLFSAPVPADAATQLLQADPVW
jgi:EAL domain-containing protein (putative c-di-GMP-specific phosphodiesterase class I)